VGFVFCSGDPYVGIDLDDCVDPETGQIELWALQIIEELDSYTEFSPSGKGVHIIVKGKIPSAVKRDEIEMYDCKRFFTITGHVVELARD
jgi:putative DNA primase/helicase